MMCVCRTQEERWENRTVSMMEFEPGVEDHGKLITCRAENPNVTGLFLEETWKIDVVCKYIYTINIDSVALFFDITAAIFLFFLRAYVTLNAYSMIFSKHYPKLSPLPSFTPS